MTDLRSDEYVSMNSHYRIYDTRLKVIISGNLVNSALYITPHEEEQWDLCPGERGGQVEWALYARSAKPQPSGAPSWFTLMWGTEHSCSLTDTALPWKLGGTS
jgi:hypothetical protein